MNKKSNQISRRGFIQTCVVAAAGVSLGASSPLVNASRKREISGKKPHIILIMTDQHRGDCLGCMGNSIINTPNIDSIARDGVVFTNGYSSTPSCTPARAGLLSGMSPWHHGMLGYSNVAVRYKYEMPRMLREAGYYTKGIGKMHWHPQRNLHGFHEVLLDESGRVESADFESDYRKWFRETVPQLDPDATGIGWNEHRAGTYVLAENLHPTYWTGDQAVQTIENYNREEPLFLKVSFARPHSPYDPPKRYLDLYQDASVPEPAVGEWAREFADYPMEKDAAFGDFGKEHVVKSRKHYYANITFIDDQVGRILDALKEKGMYDDALICFTSDHGDMLGDHHHWRKTYAYEGSAHIPFVVKWPSLMDARVRRGERLEQPVELRDFLPTFLDAAGEKVPNEMDGSSLLFLVREKHPAWRSYIDMEHATCYSPHNYWCSLTDGRQKYIWFFHDGGEQLFDLGKDPGEVHDLSKEKSYAGDLELWRQRMVEHLSERGEPYVKNDRLQVFEETLLHSPNYPK